jgi:hypothetical protein
LEVDEWADSSEEVDELDGGSEVRPELEEEAGAMDELGWDGE